MADMVGVAEVALMKGVSQRTVRNWCAAGRLTGAVKLGTGRNSAWAIPSKALEGFIPPKSSGGRKG